MSKIKDKAIKIEARGLNKDLKTALEDGSLAPSVLDQKITVTKPMDGEWSDITSQVTLLNAPNATKMDMRGRRHGSDYIIEGKIAWNGNSNVGVPANNVTVTLPAGISPSMAGTHITVGSAWSYTNTFSNLAVRADGTGLFFSRQGSGTNLVGNQAVANDLIGFRAVIPVVGWKSTESQEITIPMTQAGLIQEPDIYLQCSGNAGQTIAQNSVVPFLLSKSNTGGWDSSTNTFTIPKDGVYSISAQAVYTGNNDGRLEIHVDGDSLSAILGERVNINVHAIRHTDFFSAGQTIVIKAGVNGGTLVNAKTHRLTITHQGSLKQVNVNPNQKATIPTHEVILEAGNTRGTGLSNTAVKFNSVAFMQQDGAFEITTDATGTTIKILKKGTLTASASILQPSASYVGVYNSKKNTYFGLDTSPSNWANASGTGSVEVGDTFVVVAGANPTATPDNRLRLFLQENEVAVSVTNVLPQFSESDFVLRCANHSATTLTSNAVIPYLLSSSTRSDVWNGTEFTVFENGVYDISGSVQFTDTNVRTIELWVNGAYYKRVGINASAASTAVQFKLSDYFTAGQKLTFVSTTGGTLQNNKDWHHLSIVKQGKPNITGVDVTPFVRLPVQETSRFLGTVNLGGAAAASGWRDYAGAHTLNSNASGFGLVGNEIIIQKAGDYEFTTRIYVNVGTANVGMAQQLILNGGGTYTFVENGQVDVGHKGYTWTLKDLKVGDKVKLNYYTNTSVGTASGAIDVKYFPNSQADVLAYENREVHFSANLNTTTAHTVGTNFVPLNFIAKDTHSKWNSTGRYYEIPEDGTYTVSGAILSASGVISYANIGVYDSAGASVKFFNIAGAANSFGGAVTEWFPKGYRLMLVANSQTAGNYQVAGNGCYMTVIKINSSKINLAVLNPVAARAVQTSGQVITNVTQVNLVWDAVKQLDTHNALNTNTGVFTVPRGESGLYQINARVLTVPAAWSLGHVLDIGIVVNGANRAIARTVPPSITAHLNTCVSDLIPLKEGDTVSIYVFHNRGANTTLHNDPSWTNLSIAKIGKV